MTDLIENPVDTKVGFTTRLATPEDLADLTAAFYSMLKELAPLGHDVLPTKRNASFYGTDIFGPALEHGDHGIVVAYSEVGELVGCTFFTPECSALDTPPHRAVAHGIWVHPEWRKQGLALLIQDEAHAQLSKLGYTKLISIVVLDNAAGMASARKAGAQVTGYMTTVELGGS